MTCTTIQIPLPNTLREAAISYADEHGLTLTQMARMAMLEQIKRKPPRRLPRGVLLTRGRPTGDET